VPAGTRPVRAPPFVSTRVSSKVVVFHAGIRRRPPRKGRGDLVAALRTLDLALPERFDIDAWLIDRPKSRRDDVVHLARALGHRLTWLASEVGQLEQTRQRSR
jgi:hypothetical protein